MAGELIWGLNHGNPMPGPSWLGQSHPFRRVEIEPELPSERISYSIALDISIRYIAL
jgi:hypothetical protein